MNSINNEEVFQEQIELIKPVPFIFALVYCLTWLIFDRRGIEGYALAIFSIFIGVVYFLSPLDFIPDVIPTI